MSKFTKELKDSIVWGLEFSAFVLFMILSPVAVVEALIVFDGWVSALLFK